MRSRARSLETHRYAAAVATALTLCAVLAVPLAFTPYTEHVFEPSKAALLRFLGASAAVAGIAALVAGARPTLRGPATPILAAILAVWAADAVATVLSPVPLVGVFGAADRGQGMITLTAMVVLALGAAACASRAGGLERLAAWTAAAALPAGLYALSQGSPIALDPLPWAGDTLTRVSGTAGNSVMLAAHLAMVLPLAAAAVGSAWRRSASDGPLPLFAWLLVACAAAGALIAAGSRGPVLALGCGAAAGVLALATRRGARLLAAGIVCAAALAVAGVVVLNRPDGPLSSLAQLPVLDRLSVALDPERSTTRVRLRLWEGSAEALRTAGPRVVTGYGPESMSAVWAPHYPPILAYDEPRGWVPDRAHNFALDTLLTGGLLALAARLALFTLVVEACLGGLGLFGKKGLARTNVWRVAWILGGAAGGAAAWLGAGPALAGLGLGLGLVAGLLVWLCVRAFVEREPAAAPSFPPALLAALLALVVTHLIEIQVAFPTVSTALVLMVVAGALAGARSRSAGEGAQATDAEPPPDDAPASVDAGFAAFVVAACAAVAFAQRGLVAGGAPVAVLLLVGGAGVAALAAAMSRVWREFGARTGGRTLALAIMVGIALGGCLAVTQLTLAAIGSVSGRGSGAATASVWVAWTALGVGTLVWARAASARTGDTRRVGAEGPARPSAGLARPSAEDRARPSAEDRARPSARVTAGLALAFAALAAVAVLPLASEALMKEARLVWLPLAQRQRAEHEAGRADSLFAQAITRTTKAALLSPGSPQPLLALARLETERADGLDEFLTRRLAARADATGQSDTPAAQSTDEYAPELEADLARLVAERDEAFSRAILALDRADKLWAPAPEPALTRARALRVWAERTRAADQRGARLSAAASAYEEAALRAPRWPEVLDEAAWVELLRDNPARSVALAEAAVSLDGFYLPAHRTAASALAERGEDEAALGHYEAYFADDRNGGDLPALRGLLAVLQRVGRTEEALATGESITLLAPGSAHAWADLAVLREAGGDLEGALDAARRASELDPEDEGIAALLSGLERR